MNIQAMYPNEIFTKIRNCELTKEQIDQIEPSKWFNRQAANEVLALMHEIQLQGEPETAILDLEDYGTKEFNAA